MGRQMRVLPAMRIWPVPSSTLDDSHSEGMVDAVGESILERSGGERRVVELGEPGAVRLVRNVKAAALRVHPVGVLLRHAPSGDALGGGCPARRLDAIGGEAGGQPERGRHHVRLVREQVTLFVVEPLTFPVSPVVLLHQPARDGLHPRHVHRDAGAVVRGERRRCAVGTRPRPGRRATASCGGCHRSRPPSSRRTSGSACTRRRGPGLGAPPSRAPRPPWQRARGRCWRCPPRWGRR